MLVEHLWPAIYGEDVVVEFGQIHQTHYQKRKRPVCGSNATDPHTDDRVHAVTGLGQINLVGQVGVGAFHDQAAKKGFLRPVLRPVDGLFELAGSASDGVTLHEARICGCAQRGPSPARSGYATFGP